MKHIIFVVLAAFTLVACESTVRPDEGTAEGGVDESGRSGAEVGSIDGSGVTPGSSLPVSYEKGAINDPQSILSGRIVYFDFDSSTIGDAYQELVKHHGKYLALNTDASIRLEGHTDERGTREYNVALGDRRAQAVKRMLMYQGAASDQITIISYGEEKPAQVGSDEESWSMNRRAELVYQ